MGIEKNIMGWKERTERHEIHINNSQFKQFAKSVDKLKVINAFLKVKNAFLNYHTKNMMYLILK